VVKTIDVAVLVISENTFGEPEEKWIKDLVFYAIPFVIVHNKSDKEVLSDKLKKRLLGFKVPVLECSSFQKSGMDELVNALVKITPSSAYVSNSFVGDIVEPGALVVLVMPQDSEAPEGRLILPQVQLIRDILDNHAVAIGLQPQELEAYIKKQTPDLVITDSQAFDFVSKIVPAGLPLSSFSIILARAKGNFEDYLKGTPHISKLKDGDKILMLESCTHVTSCEDIGRHKIPQMLRKFTGKELHFEWVSALSPLPDLHQFAMGIQCGACMVTQKQVFVRMKHLLDKKIPISNYGMTIAYVTGIFNRVTEIFNHK